MKLNQLTHIYFLGIGGIGMSALARFFRASGKIVAGYDKTSSELTDKLMKEGIQIHFEENISLIPKEFLNTNGKEKILIVWTPAVPKDHAELVWFTENNFTLMKRAQVLGLIAGETNTIAIAGTHGKTTTTTLTAHLLKTAGVDCSAFLGGISQNYQTNLLLGKNLGKENIPMEENIVVAEADEYDRSFLWLHPSIAVVTSVDADHLDIYGDNEAMLDTYRQFVKQVGKTIVTKKSVAEILGITNDKRVISYSLEDKATDSFAENIRVENGYYVFDLTLNKTKISNLRLGLPGRHNVENAVAAASAAKQIGVDEESIRKGLSSFLGVKRRFDFRVRSPQVVYIDDYGHHPAELKACISSVKELFPGKKITGIFQPHLYSRTRDFADEFAKSLDLLDDVVLLEIYPAREKPIPGITSSMLLEKIVAKRKALYSKSEVVEKVLKHEFDVLLTMGAGDIDQFIAPLQKGLKDKFNLKEALS
jgi:UDP-N-acetylmuramate--alanine ligase